MGGKQRKENMALASVSWVAWLLFSAYFLSVQRTQRPDSEGTCEAHRGSCVGGGHCSLHCLAKAQQGDFPAPPGPHGDLTGDPMLPVKEPDWWPQEILSAPLSLFLGPKCDGISRLFLQSEFSYLSSLLHQEFLRGTLSFFSGL